MARATVVLVAGLTAVCTLAALLVLHTQHALPALPDIAAPRLSADCLAGGVELDHEDVALVSAEAASAARAGTSVRAAVARTMPDARAADVDRVTRALTGRAKAALTCRSDPVVDSFRDSGPSRLGPDGLTRRADAVHRDIRSRFGRVPTGGFAPGGVSSGHRRGSAHYEGRAIDVFYRPVSAAAKVRGWALARYLVAQADRLGVQTVIFDGRIWSRWRSAQGWRHYDVDVADSPRRTRQILEHRDHVHVDV